MLHVTTTNPAPSVRTRALATPSTNTPTNTKKKTPLWRKTSEPDAKQLSHIPRPQQAWMPNNIGKYVVRDAEELTSLGWTKLVRRQQGR